MEGRGGEVWVGEVVGWRWGGEGDVVSVVPGTFYQRARQIAARLCRRGSLVEPREYHNERHFLATTHWHRIHFLTMTHKVVSYVYFMVFEMMKPAIKKNSLRHHPSCVTAQMVAPHV